MTAVSTETRKTGIEVVGDMPWGTHFCLFYETKEDLLEILTSYCKAGLESGEFCLWIVAEPLTVEEATASFPKEAGIARYGEPEEIAELMAFLVSPGAKWMTGSSLRMDGGEVKSI